MAKYVTKSQFQKSYTATKKIGHKDRATGKKGSPSGRTMMARGLKNIRRSFKAGGGKVPYHRFSPHGVKLDYRAQ